MIATPEDTPDRSRFTTITKHLGRYKKHLVVGSIALLMSNALIFVIPYIIKIVIDRLEAGGEPGFVLWMALLMLALAAGSGLFRFLVRRTIIWMSRHLEYHIRGEIFDHLLKLSPGFYHETRTGDVMARTTNDLEAVRMMIGPGLMHIVNTAVSLIFALAFMVYLSPKLTLYAFLPLLIFPYLVNKLGNLVHKKFITIQEQFSKMTVAAQENLAGIRVIKAYGQESAEIESFAGVSEDYAQHNLSMARLQGLFFPMIRFLAAGINLVILAVGGHEVIEGGLALGTLVAFLSYINALLWPMFAIGWVVSLYQRGTASLDRINSILHTEPEIRDIGQNLYDKPMNGRIEITNLNFAYKHTAVLKDINMTIEPGQTIGLIGTTGSGKTTIVSLLAKLYPVERSKIKIDGVDINDWQLSALRSQIGFAPQEPFLFSDTIAENIKLGLTDAKPQAIANAARAAALTKDIDTFPAGFNTLVGERGITLSGGQKQRTAIARALIADPVILVLDDVTSAVDTETEDEILRSLEAGQGDRTRIIISHRVSAVKNADRIYFLSDGRVTEEGSHEQLMQINQSYAELYRAQLLEKEIEAL